MTSTRAPRPASSLIGSYGRAWVASVLAEHLDRFVALGGTVRPAASGSGASWAIVDGIAYPVVCGDIIEVPTEDGVIFGRCGLPATVEGACTSHAEEHDAWAASSEAERLAWERARG